MTQRVAQGIISCQLSISCQNMPHSRLVPLDEARFGPKLAGMGSEQRILVLAQGVEP